MTGATGALVWVIIAAVLFVVEGVTTQLVGVWFAVGAVVAVVPSYLGAPVWFQLLIFLASSVLFLILIRPAVKERISVKKVPTNADMVVGQTGLVLEEINNIKETGRVSAMGLTWTARTEDDRIIPAEAQVQVIRIEGVKIIVALKSEIEGGSV